MILAFNAGILGLALTACGGGSSTDAADSSALPVTVSGADKASVSFRAFDSQAARQVTVQVARDATGAPPLDENYTPLGAVYQFTPLGWVEEEIEIRLPLPEEAIANGRPRLLIASPGGEWSDVIDAKREGDFIVARVPHLAYATVASHVGVNRLERSQALAGGSATGAAVTSAAVPNPLNLRFNPGTTSPALPAPGSTGLVTVTKNTSLGLEASVLLGSYCTVDTKLSLSATVLRPGSSVVTTVQLGERLFPTYTSNASALFDLPLSSSNNGTWKFAATVRCQGPTQGVAPYSANIVGPSLIVNIAANPAAPLIAAAPQDIGVTAGNAANFSVTAQGTSLSYAWQRSNDGGATYAPVGSVASFSLVAALTDNGALFNDCGVTYAPVAGTAASLCFVAALTDNGALFRVKVSNAAGSATSTPALLKVAAKVVPLVVTSDPASKSVVEGQTASFSVAGSGAPAPTIQWQRVAVGAPAGTWVDLAGATSATYVTAVTTLAQSGTQYRAVLRNSGGTVASRGATLTVQARVIAPAIVSQPLSREVFAGEFGLFSVSASGTSPLSYQWFKNELPLTGENAATLKLYALAADVGSSYRLRVRISNTGGTVDSAVVTLKVQVPGTRITASAGGSVAGVNGVSLSVSPGALGGDTTIALVSETVAPASLPVGVIALSDIVEIKPAGLVFGKPASISFSVKQDIPPGMALVVLKLDSRNAPLGLRRTAALVSEADSRVLAQAVAGPVTLPANPLCQSPQYVDAAGTFTLAGIAAAVRTMVVAVPESMCSAIAVLPAGQVPVDTTSACDRDSQFGYVGSRAPAGLTDDESSLLNRHVNCRASQSGEDYVEVDMLKDVDGGLTRIAPASADLGTTDTVQVALVKFEFQVSMFGKSDVLGKTLRYRARVSSYQENATYKGPNKRPDVYLRPKLESYCYAVGYDGFPEPASSKCAYTPKAIRASAGGGWSEWADMPIGFQWTTAPGNSYDMAFFNINLELFETRIEGSDAQFKRPGARPSKTMTSGLGYLPTLRCDRGLAEVRTTGCVFPQAAAVYVLKTSDSSVTEAAEHVGEAQASGSPGRFALKPGTRAFPDSASGGRGLQRFKNAVDYDDPNRKAACQSTNALIKTRPPQSSRTCSPNAPGCECDEYPFNSTWQGAAFAPNTTSVKWINRNQNQNAGGGKLSNWYRVERLLDLANRPADGVTLPSGGGSSDFFWAYGSIN